MAKSNSAFEKFLLEALGQASAAIQFAAESYCAQRQSVALRLAVLRDRKRKQPLLTRSRRQKPEAKNSRSV